MTDWAVSWALLVLARCSQSEAQALRARSQVQAPRIRSVELQAKYIQWECSRSVPQSAQEDVLEGVFWTLSKNCSWN